MYLVESGSDEISTVISDDFVVMVLIDRESRTKLLGWPNFHGERNNCLFFFAWPSNIREITLQLYTLPLHVSSFRQTFTLVFFIFWTFISGIMQTMLILYTSTNFATSNYCTFCSMCSVCLRLKVILQNYYWHFKIVIMYNFKCNFYSLWYVYIRKMSAYGFFGSRNSKF